MYNIILNGFMGIREWNYISIQYINKFENKRKKNKILKQLERLSSLSLSLSTNSINLMYFEITENCMKEKKFLIKRIVKRR